MHEGEICLDLPQSEAFQDTSIFRNLGVELPVPEKSSNDTEKRSSLHIQSKDTLLEVQNLYYHYPSSEVQAVKDISFEVSRGEVVAIMGENGSGKTTLLNLIAVLLQPDAGQVPIDGKDVKRLKLHQLAGKVGIVFQNPDLLLQAETVCDEVEFGPKNLKLKSDKLNILVNDTLTQFRLSDLSEEAPYSLSRGQRQRVAVAATFSLHPDIFLLDEPTTGQDAQHLQLLMDELCNHIRQENRALIFATHNIELVQKYADRVLLMHEGELIYDGSPAATFTDKDILQKTLLI